MRVLSQLLCLLIALGSWGQAPSPLSADQDIQSFVSNKQLDTAERIVVGRLLKQPHDAGLVTWLAEIRLDQGRTEEAIQLADEAEGLDRATALRAQIAGLAYSVQGRLAPAEIQFRRAIQLDPTFVPAHYYLARLLYTRNRFDEAIEESKTTISLSPGFVRAYENLGLCYEGKDQRKEAEAWYREAIRRDAASASKTEWPLVDLAKLLTLDGRLDQARPFLDQALSINPSNAQVHFQMGILLEKSGEAQQALQQYRDSVKYDAKLAGAYYRAAQLCQKLGRKDDAAQLFDEYKRVSRLENGN